MFQIGWLESFDPTAALVPGSVAQQQSQQMTILEQSLHPQVAGIYVTLQQMADALSTFATQLGQVSGEVDARQPASTAELQSLESSVSCLKQAVETLQSGQDVRVGGYCAKFTRASSIG